METITFTSKSKRKLDLLIQVAKEMGIKTNAERELTDEEMGMPGANPTKKQMEEWLVKDDGESYTEEEMLEYVKGNLARNRKKKAA